MTAPPAHLDLAGDFPPASREQWRALVAAVLARSGVPATGAPEDALAHRTPDGLTLAPLYTAADLPDGPDAAGSPGRPPFVRGSRAERAGWDVRQRVSEPEPGEANRAMLAELAGGASSIWLQLGDGGLPVQALAAALDGVYLDLAPLALDAGAATGPAAEALLRLIAERGMDPAEVAGTLGGDPIGLAASTGRAPRLAVVTELAALTTDHPRLLPVTVDATIYADAGGSDSDELAISLAVGLAYLRALTDAGLSIEAALARLEFRYSMNADQFASIAKLRAGRRLWDRVGELCGAVAASRGQRQHAVTSAAMTTRRDPWVNLLRSTIGCFAAAVGGADAITVAPFDSAIGLPEDFGRRIARNTQSILHDESSLARVLDPAGGSYYVESLTEQLAEVAWSKFTSLERAGGAVSALESGMIGQLLHASWERRRDRIGRRQEPITGVSEYAMAAEHPIRRRPWPPRPAGGLPRVRYGEPFEALRERCDAHLAATGVRPKAFLAALGPPPAHTARLTFTRNLLQVGGIEAVLGSGDEAELVAQLQASGTVLAVLCSSDSVYADRARPVATALKAAGAAQVWIAGPPELVSGSPVSGSPVSGSPVSGSPVSGSPVSGSPVSGSIDSALYAGCDAVAVLRSMLDVLEVAW